MIGFLALILVLVITFLQDIGLAEPITEQVWVLCDPDSYVTLRSGPGKSKPDFGGVLCGAELWTAAGRGRYRMDQRPVHRLRQTGRSEPAHGDPHRRARGMPEMGKREADRLDL